MRAPIYLVRKQHLESIEQKKIKAAAASYLAPLPRKFVPTQKVIPKVTTLLTSMLKIFLRKKKIKKGLFLTKFKFLTNISIISHRIVNSYKKKKYPRGFSSLFFRLKYQPALHFPSVWAKPIKLAAFFYSKLRYSRRWHWHLDSKTQWFKRRILLKFIRNTKKSPFILDKRFRTLRKFTYKRPWLLRKTPKLRLAPFKRSKVYSLIFPYLKNNNLAKAFFLHRALRKRGLEMRTILKITHNYILSDILQNKTWKLTRFWIKPSYMRRLFLNYFFISNKTRVFSIIKNITKAKSYKLTKFFNLFQYSLFSVLYSAFGFLGLKHLFTWIKAGLFSINSEVCTNPLASCYATDLIQFNILPAVIGPTLEDYLNSKYFFNIIDNHTLKFTHIMSIILTSFRSNLIERKRKPKICYKPITYLKYKNKIKSHISLGHFVTLYSHLYDLRTIHTLPAEMGNKKKVELIFKDFMRKRMIISDLLSNYSVSIESIAVSLFLFYKKHSSIFLWTIKQKKRIPFLPSQATSYLNKTDTLILTNKRQRSPLSKIKHYKPSPAISIPFRTAKFWKRLFRVKGFLLSSDKVQKTMLKNSIVRTYAKWVNSDESRQTWVQDSTILFWNANQAFRKEMPIEWFSRKRLSRRTFIMRLPLYLRKFAKVTSIDTYTGRPEYGEFSWTKICRKLLFKLGKKSIHPNQAFLSDSLANIYRYSLVHHIIRIQNFRLASSILDTNYIGSRKYSASLINENILVDTDIFACVLLNRSGKKTGRREFLNRSCIRFLLSFC